MHLPVSVPKLGAFRLGPGLQTACAVLTALAASAPAAAQFTVCNNNAKTEIRVAVSVAVNGANGAVGYDFPMTTSGSTAVAAGQCQVILLASLRDVARLYLFAWEPSNQAHTWGGDPKDNTEHCLPAGSTDPTFMYHDQEYNNPPCAAGYEKEPFMFVPITSYRLTEEFKDPLEGVVPPATNQPAVSAAPGKAPSAGGVKSTAAPAPAAVPKPAPAAAPAPAIAAAPKPAPAVLSTPNAPTGNAVLVVTSGLTAQPGAPNPLSGHTVVLLNQSFESVLTGAGLQAPQGVSLVKGYLAACASKQPACQAGINATNSSTVSGAQTDASGKAQLPGVPPGTYYVFCLGAYNNQLFKWDFQVQLKAGANSLTLGQQNAAAVN